MHDWLRQQWRDRMGRAPDPTAAVIDAQSTRSTAPGGNTGFDAGKQAKRWVVERTHAWNERARRLMAHHDQPKLGPHAWVWLAEARILATRLAT